MDTLEALQIIGAEIIGATINDSFSEVIKKCQYVAFM
jgi:hypothetical protein